MRQTTACDRFTLFANAGFAACSLFVAMVVMASDKAMGEEVPDAKFLLERLDSALSMPEQIHFQGEVQHFWKTGPQSEKRMVQKENYNYWRSGNRYKLALARGVYGWDQSRNPNFLYREYILGDRELLVHVDGVRRPTDGLVSLLRSPNEYGGQIEPGCRLRTSPDDVDSLHGCLKGAEFLHGQLWCDKSRLPEVLAHCDLHVSDAEVIDGHRTWVLEAESEKFGYYTVWIDPEANYLPRRIAVYKSGHNVLVETPIDEIELYVDPNEPVPDSKITATEVQLQNVRIEKIDDVYCLTGFDINIGDSYEMGGAFFHIYECRLSDFQPQPNLTAADFRITLQIPDGTPVGMGDSAEGEYVWHDGDIKLIRQDSDDSNIDARQTSQQRIPVTAGFWSPRTSQLLGNLAAMFLAVAAMSIEREKKNTGTKPATR